MVKQRKIMEHLSLHSDFKLVKKLLRLAYVTIMGKSNKNKYNCSHEPMFSFIPIYRVVLVCYIYFYGFMMCL